MAINQAPPPPQPAPVPAQIQTVNSAHAQRLASPEQSVINDINSGKFGKGFTASMPNQTGSSSTQNVRKVIDAVNDLGGAVKDGQNLKTNSIKAGELGNALSKRQPGYTQRPPGQSSGNKAIENMKGKPANGQQSTSQRASQPSQNKGVAAARQKSSTGQSRTAQSNASTNKGITSFHNKSSGQTSSPTKPSSSTNKGISSFQNRASGQASSAAKGSSSGQTTSASRGSSSGASKGGQSR